MPKLIIEKGPDRGGEVDLPVDGSFVFGRESTQFKMKDSWASRQHFKIEPRDGHFFLVDLKSMNGTFVNGHRVHEAKLAVGDLIKVGETLFSFMGDGPKDALIGQKLAGYRIIERVGRGGMGTVYRAEQIDLQRQVAVKVISPEYASNREFIERFINEARAAARLNHPNVVQVYDVKRDGKIYFFSMEFMANGSLQSILGPVKKLPLQKSVKMILDAARGLEYAHGKQIVHRDIKPDNMMVADTGAVKIGDLGLAAGLDHTASSEEERYVLGTPHYIAPEQLLGRPADFRSDIYSLGSSLYRVLAGRPPFSGAGVQEIVNRKVREDAARIDTLVPGLPPSVVKALGRMLEREPEKRHGTMTEVVKELEEIHDQLRSGGRGTERREAKPKPRSIRELLRQPAAWAVAGSVLVLSALVAWFAFGGEADQNGSSKNGDHAPNDGSGEDPKVLLGAAELAGDGLKPSSPTAQIDMVIQMYEEVIREFPGTQHEEAARKAIQSLRGRKSLAAQQTTLDLLRKEDESAWNEFVKGFTPETPSTAGIEGILAQYRTLERAHPGSPVGSQAQERADHIEKWLTAFQKAREAYPREWEKIDQETAQGHWAAARGVLDGFLRMTDPLERFNLEPLHDELLWDKVAQKKSAALIAAAREDFRKFWDSIQTVSLVTKERWEDVRRQIESREPDFDISEVNFRGKKADFEIAFTSWKKTNENKVMAEAAAADEADFDQACRKAHDGFRKNFRIKDVRAQIVALEPLRTVEFQRRLKTRVEELDAAAAFLAAFNEAARGGDRIVYPDIANGGFAYKDRPIKGLDLEAPAFMIEGATAPKRFGDFAPGPEQLLAVLKKWEKPDAHAYGLAILAMELGEYGEAATLLKALADGEPAAREKLRDLEQLTLAQSREEQAWRRYYKIDRLVGAGKNAEAAAELAVLKAKFKGSTVFVENETTIRRWETTLGEAPAPKEASPGRREAAGKRLAAERTRAETQRAVLEEAIKAADWSREQPERHWVTGLLAVGRRDLAAASASFDLMAQGCRSVTTALRGSDARERAERLLWGLVLRCQVEVLLKREPPVTGTADFVREVFGRDSPNFYDNWADSKAGTFRPWREALARFEAAPLEALRKKLEADPSDEKGIWTLVDGLFLYRRDYGEARAWLRVLMDEFPEAAPVKSGEALFRYAECNLFLLDVERARRAYERIPQEVPTHPRARGTSYEDSVTRRLALTSWLAERLKLAPDEP